MTSAWRLGRMLMLATLPLLYLPLRAAEAPPTQTQPPSAEPQATSQSDAPADTASRTATASDDAEAVADDASEDEQQPPERVSADNNLSFPVDI